MKTKIDQHGRVFDPSAEALHGHTLLRLFLEEAALGPSRISPVRYARLSRALNVIGDRLATADALEMRAERREVPQEKKA